MFKALLLTQPVPRETRAECVELDEASLPAGAVRVAVSHSTLNYKDALAITGRSPVVRQPVSERSQTIPVVHVPSAVYESVPCTEVRNFSRTA